MIETRIPVEQFLSFFQKLTAYKKSITLSQLLRQYTTDFDDKYFFTLIHRIL